MRRRILASVGGAPLPYDAEVEYILSSTKKEYIRLLNLPISKIIRFSIQLESTDTAGGSKVVYSPTAGSQGWCGWRDSKVYTAGSGSLDLSAHEKHEFVIDEFATNADVRTYTVDSISAGEYNSYKNTLVYLFSISGSYGSNTRLYNFSVEDFNGVLLIDAIPVRYTNENGVSEGALYDKVRKQLILNQGTGKFTYGQDVT